MTQTTEKYWDLYFWSALMAGISSELGTLNRFCVETDGERTITNWSSWLTVPVPGYLENSDGPVRAREVVWIELLPKDAEALSRLSALSRAELRQACEVTRGPGSRSAPRESVRLWQRLVDRSSV